MNQRLGVILLALLLAASLLACEKNEDNEKHPAAADDDAADDDAADDDAGPVYTENYRFDLSFEVQFKATLRLAQHADGTLDGAFTPEQGFDVVEAGVTLLGEALGRMIALKLHGPALPGSPCGDQPISYSLTLTAKENNGYMVGGVTAYCGENVFSGRPARLMRISGVQEREEE
jgi:hypothetical protein